MKISTAIKRKHPSNAPTLAAESKESGVEEKVHYPEFAITGEAARKLLGKMKAGDKATLTIEVEVSLTREQSDAAKKQYEWNDDQISFDVKSVEADCCDEEEEEPEEEDAAEAMDKFRKKKKTTQEEE